METIRDDEPVTAEQFKAFVNAMRWHTQLDAAEALGVTQAYISLLSNGRKRVEPGTSLHKLLQALQREQKLLRRLSRVESAADEAPTG